MEESADHLKNHVYVYVKITNKQQNKLPKTTLEIFGVLLKTLLKIQNNEDENDNYSDDNIDSDSATESDDSDT